MPQFSPEEKQRIERALIEEGTRLFTEKGLKNTTVDNLTARVQIAKGTFYHFFENKEALFFRCMEAHEALIEERELNPIFANASDPEAMLADLLRFSADLPAAYPFFRVASEPETLLHLRKRLPEEIWNEHFRRDLEDTDRFYRRWAEQGLECRLDASTFNGVFRALIMMSFQRREIGETVYPAVMDLMIRALARELIRWFDKKER